MGYSSKRDFQDPEILKEFNEVKRTMEEDGISFEGALALLRQEKGELAFDNLSSEARDAMISLIEEKWNSK